MDESEGETRKDVRGGLEGRVKGNSIGRRQMIVSINDQRASRLCAPVHPSASSTLLSGWGEKRAEVRRSTHGPFGFMGYDSRCSE